jgi:hypothetical protein
MGYSWLALLTRVLAPRTTMGTRSPSVVQFRQPLQIWLLEVGEALERYWYCLR